MWGGGVVFHGSWKGALLDGGRNTCSPREHRKFTYGKQLGESMILPITSILHAFNQLPEFTHKFSKKGYL